MTASKRRPAKRVKAGTSKATAAQRKALFVEAYLINGGNATEAAIAAGFPKRSAGSRGHEIVKDREIFAEITRRRAEVVGKAEAITGLTIERTLREVGRIAYSDPRKFLDADGKRIPVHLLDDDTAATISGMEFDEITAEGGAVIGQKVKLKWWDKNAALEKAMKHFGQYEADNKQKPLPVLPPILNIIAVPGRK